MKYIATREGVEVLNGKGPATEKQKEMVTKLLKDFPDMRDSFEYEDYKQAPTLHTASALISAALDTHMQNLQSENGYLRYSATRPGAEKAWRTRAVWAGGQCGLERGDARSELARRQRLDDHLFPAPRGRRALGIQTTPPHGGSCLSAIRTSLQKRSMFRHRRCTGMQLTTTRIRTRTFT